VSAGADIPGARVDWLVFTWEQDGGLALRRSSLPPGEWEAWQRQLFTLAEVQRASGAPSRPSLCRQMIGGRPVAMNRDPSSDADPRARIRTYAYTGTASLLGPREVLAVVDSWHGRLPRSAPDGPPLASAGPLALTSEIRGALTGAARGVPPDAPPGTPSAGLPPLAVGLPRLAAEVLRRPDSRFSCQIAPEADAGVIMWGLMDLLDRVVGTADDGYWTFSTEQSDDFDPGLPRFVFLSQWPHSAKQSRHIRLDLTRDIRFAEDDYYGAAERLIEAYLRGPGEVAELCRAAGLRDQDLDDRQIKRLLEYLGLHPAAVPGPPRETTGLARRALRPVERAPSEPDEPSPGHAYIPNETYPADEARLTARADAPEGTTIAEHEPRAAEPGPSGDGTAEVTRALRHQTGGLPFTRRQDRRGMPGEADRSDLLESADEDRPAHRRSSAPDELDPDRPGTMDLLVKSVRRASTARDLQECLRQIRVSASADPGNRAVLRAALEEYGWFNDHFHRILSADDVETELERVVECGFHDEDLTIYAVFERSARIVGRHATPQVVMMKLTRLMLDNVPERTQSWYDIVVQERQCSEAARSGQSARPPASWAAEIPVTAGAGKKSSSPGSGIWQVFTSERFWLGVLLLLVVLAILLGVSGLSSIFGEPRRPLQAPDAPSSFSVGSHR
jgi:hypothetical protein